jgi:parafibromin
LRPDRLKLLSYLDGEILTTPSIDRNAPLEIAMLVPQPYIKSGISTNATTSLQTTSTSTNKEQQQQQQQQQQFDIDQNEKSINEENQKSNDDQPNILTNKNEFIDRISKKFDETNEHSSRPITANITALSKELTMEKIASLKAKKQALKRKQISSTGDDLISDDIGIELTNNNNSQSMSGVGHHQKDIHYVTPSMSSDESVSIMQEIIQRERVCRNRFSVLQSTGKEFDKDIMAFLQTIKLKEENHLSNVKNGNEISTLINANVNTAQNVNTAISNTAPNATQRQLGYNRFDQERYGAKDETGGFSIDTKLTYQPNGGSISLANNPNQTPQHPSSRNSISTESKTPMPTSHHLTPQKTNIQATGKVKPEYTTAPLPPPPPTTTPQKRQHQKPIIVIPNTRTSLITMVNCLDILQDLKYISTEDKKKTMQTQNFNKEAEIIMHKREDGKTIQFKVIDNVLKLQPQDW